MAFATKVTLGGIALPLKEVSWIDGMGWLQRMGVARLGAGGMVGNKLFIGRKLIIDTDKLEFGIETPTAPGAETEARETVAKGPIPTEDSADTFGRLLPTPGYRM